MQQSTNFASAEDPAIAQSSADHVDQQQPKLINTTQSQPENLTNSATSLTQPISSALDSAAVSGQPSDLPAKDLSEAKPGQDVSDSSKPLFSKSLFPPAGLGGNSLGGATSMLGGLKLGQPVATGQESSLSSSNNLQARSDVSGADAPISSLAGASSYQEGGVMPSQSQSQSSVPVSGLGAGNTALGLGFSGLGSLNLGQGSEGGLFRAMQAPKGLGLLPSSSTQPISQKPPQLLAQLNSAEKQDPAIASAVVQSLPLNMQTNVQNILVQQQQLFGSLKPISNLGGPPAATSSFSANDNIDSVESKNTLAGGQSVQQPSQGTISPSPKSTLPAQKESTQPQTAPSSNLGQLLGMGSSGGNMLSYNLLPSVNQSLAPKTGSTSTGEVVTGQNYQYHSLEGFAHQVAQDLDLSLDQVDSSKAKVFTDSDNLSSSSVKQRSAIVLLTGKPAHSSNQSNNGSNQAQSNLQQRGSSQQTGQNLSVLVDQSELCMGVLSNAVLAELAIEEILDFTLVNFHLLVVLAQTQAVGPKRPAAKKLFTFECSTLFQGNVQQQSSTANSAGQAAAMGAGGAWSSTQVRFLHALELPQQSAVVPPGQANPSQQQSQSQNNQNASWNRVELCDSCNDLLQVVVAGGTRICLATLPLLGSPDEEPSLQNLELPQDDGQIVALQCIGHKLITCFKDKTKGSTVTMHDMRLCSLTFKASYPDLDEVQNLCYVPDVFKGFSTNNQIVSSAMDSPQKSNFAANSQMPQQSSSTTTLNQDLESGQLILTELQKQKYLKKIHIVQLSQKQKAKKRIDKCEQVDSLTFSDKSAKLIDIIQQNGAYFVMCCNYESIIKTATSNPSAAKVRLTCVKIGWQDSFQQLQGSEIDHNTPRLVFKYVSEVQGMASPSILNINQQMAMGEKIKPTFVRAIEREGTMFVYLGLAGQVIVFQRSLTELQASTGCNTPPVVPQQIISKLGGSAKEVGQLSADDFIAMVDEENRQALIDRDSHIDKTGKKTMDDLDSITLNQLGNQNQASNMLKVSSAQQLDTTSSNAEQTEKVQNKKTKAQKFQEKKVEQQAKKLAKQTQQSPHALAQQNSSQSIHTPNPKQQNQGNTNQSNTNQANQANPASSSQQNQAQALQNQSAQLSGRKSQQDQIIENYAELNRNYTNLNMKLNQLQQLVQAQKDLQVQVEATVAKAVRGALPELVKKQVEETVPACVQAQAELFDRQVRQVVIPKLESVLKAASVEKLQVRDLLLQEFRETLAKDIVPEMERTMRSMIGQIREPLGQVNKAINEKVNTEEQRIEMMVQSMAERARQVNIAERNLQLRQQQQQVQQVQQQQQSQGFYQQPPLQFQHSQPQQQHTQHSAQQVFQQPAFQQAHSQTLSQIQPSNFIQVQAAPGSGQGQPQQQQQQSHSLQFVTQQSAPPQQQQLGLNNQSSFVDHHSQQSNSLSYQTAQQNNNSFTPTNNNSTHHHAVGNGSNNNHSHHHSNSHHHTGTQQQQQTPQNNPQGNPQANPPPFQGFNQQHQAQNPNAQQNATPNSQTANAFQNVVAFQPFTPNAAATSKEFVTQHYQPQPLGQQQKTANGSLLFSPNNGHDLSKDVEEFKPTYQQQTQPMNNLAGNPSVNVLGSANQIGMGEMSQVVQQQSIQKIQNAASNANVLVIDSATADSNNQEEHKQFVALSPIQNSAQEDSSTQQ